MSTDSSFEPVRSGDFRTRFADLDEQAIILQGSSLATADAVLPPDNRAGGGAVAPLETPTDSGHTLGQLIASWLAGVTDSPDTRDGYRIALRQYLAWCSDRGLDPLDVTLPEANVYAGHLQTQGYARKTRGLKLSAVASFYRYLVEVGAITQDPYRGVKRPRARDPETPTETVTEQQAVQLLAAVQQVRSRALGPYLGPLLLHLMIDTGARVSELCNANTADLGRRGDQRTITMHMKGGKTRVRPVPVQLGPLLDAYRVHRPTAAEPDAEAALFVDQRGRRIHRQQLTQLIKRVSRDAELDVRLSPHSMRHAFNTIAKLRGAELEDRRDALGHSSAAVTQGYDHAKLSFERDPAHLVAAATGAVGVYQQEHQEEHSEQ